MELRRYSYERLDGSVRAEERFAAIKNFSAKTERGLDSEVDGSNAFVFMISTRAGGVGLNLVAADTVRYFWLLFFHIISCGNRIHRHRER